MIRRVVLTVLVAFPLIHVPLAVTQTGADELWEVTAKVTMDGMAMPAMPRKVCKKKGDNIPPVEQNCQTLDVKTEGNRTTYRVECTGKDAMSGVGEITMGNGTYQGTLKMTAKVDGQDSTMVTEYSGKLLGNCTAK
jgi:hypothetical protein